MAPTQNIPGSGIWGKPTATLDWCEENYIVTQYIAEFWNTISNVIMIIPGFVGALYYWKKGFEFRYVLSNLFLLAVGIGSWMFHMTLLYEMQLLDELPMIYATCVLLYSLRHHTKPPKHRSISYIVALILCSIFVTVVYLIWKNPIFHQVCYGMLVLLLLYEAVCAVNNYPAIKPIMLTSLCFYLLGFALWNIDNGFCSTLRKARSSGNVFVRGGTQLHAWWHVFTGYATYLHILFSSYARTLHLKKPCGIKLLDELPMIYGTCLYVYVLRSRHSPANVLDRKWFLITGFYCALFTFVYAMVKTPILFQLGYGLLVILSVYDTSLLCRRDPTMTSLALRAFIFYLLGFILWNIDNNYCPSLRLVRYNWSSFHPMSFVTNLHAWWHLCAGYASIVQLQLLAYIRITRMHSFLNRPVKESKTLTVNVLSTQKLLYNV